MGLLDFLRSRPKNTATLATQRLRFIVEQERSTKGQPDYLPLLRRELLEVIRKYVVDIDPNAIEIRVDRDGDSEVLELTVALPEKPNPPRAAAARVGKG